MKHRVRFVLAVMVGCLLFAPSVAGAALVPAGGWQQIADDDEEYSAKYAYMDIDYAQHSFEGGFHFFQIVLVGNSTTAADYSIVIKQGTGGSYPDPGDISFGFQNLVLFDPATVVLEQGGAGTTTLGWRTNNLNGWTAFTWWAVAMQDTSMAADWTVPVVTPIPNAVWLLGSGLIGLIGLRRRIRK